MLVNSHAEHYDTINLFPTISAKFYYFLKDILNWSNYSKIGHWLHGVVVEKDMISCCVWS
jgi:hypothetical protein